MLLKQCLYSEKKENKREAFERKAEDASTTFRVMKSSMLWWVACDVICKARNACSILVAKVVVNEMKNYFETLSMQISYEVRGKYI
jgi:hypothetical protein